jgi:DNA polymerase III psi subunit
MFSENDKVYQIPEKLLLENARGGFARRVLVIVQAEPIHPNNLAFLTKILLAAGLDLEQDTLLVEIPEYDQTSFLPAAKEKQPASILVFGASPKQLGINAQIQFYQPTLFYGINFLFSEKLSTLEPDKTRKANLWQALRQMFL